MRPRRIVAALALAAALACGRDAAPDEVDAPAVREATRRFTPPTIVDRPITFDEDRVALTLEYRRTHLGERRPTMEIEPRVIVLHYTDSAAAEETWRYFDRARLTADRTEVAGGGALNVSAHFLVDRDGAIWRLMPETWFARHCIGLNHVAIGIENAGSAAEPLTPAQVEANAALVRYLARRQAITHLIGHSEYRRMEGHPYFREADPGYRTEKVDPGDEFLAAVRARVDDLGLKGPPAAAPE